MNLRWIVAAIIAVALLLAFSRFGDARYKAGAAHVRAQWSAEREVSQAAFDQAARHVEQLAAADLAAAQEVERELRQQMVAADGASRDLARRLRDATRTRAAGCAVPGPADSASEPARESGESGSDAALEDVFAACARDATRLDGWEAWWAGIEANRL